MCQVDITMFSFVWHLKVLMSKVAIIRSYRRLKRFSAFKVTLPLVRTITTLICTWGSIQLMLLQRFPATLTNFYFNQGQGYICNVGCDGYRIITLSCQLWDEGKCQLTKTSIPPLTNQDRVRHFQSCGNYTSFLLTMLSKSLFLYWKKKRNFITYLLLYFTCIINQSSHVFLSSYWKPSTLG